MKLYICRDITKAKWKKKVDDEKASAVFAKKCISDFLNIRNSKISVAFSRNAYGKPLIKSIRGEDGAEIDVALNFSLAHSEKMIICAVACFNIGADCQKKNIKDIGSCKKIAKRFYTSDENSYLNSLNDDLYIDNFFEIWTKKEAYIKYTGKGLAEGLTSFSTADGVSGQKDSFGDVTFKNIKVKGAEDFLVSLCYNKRNRNEIEVKYI